MNAHSFKPNSLAAASFSPVGAAATPADAHYAAEEARLVAEGYGTGPRCVMCRRNQAGCHCDSPEPDVMHVSDMKRVMPRLFERKRA